MGYTALETMKKENLKRYGVDYGPHQPPFQNYDGNDLKSAAKKKLKIFVKTLIMNLIKSMKN